MKRILYILSCALALTTVVSCDWFELDNQDGWDAKVKGQILDSKTNQPLQSEQGAAITIIEQGWKDPVSGNQITQNQSWLIKNDGTYRNDLVFAGEYIMNTVSDANFIADPASFTLKKGENTVDFKVTPFCRIVSPSVTYDSATGKIKATFKVESDIANVNNIGRAMICVYPDRFVRQGYNKCEKDPEASVTNIDPASGELITLYVDTKLDKNADEFQYNRPHYIRIAAVGAHYKGMPAYDEDLGTDWDRWMEATVPLADDYSNWAEFEASIPHKIVHHEASYANDGSLNNKDKYNYSPVYKLENGTITEVTDW